MDNIELEIEDEKVEIVFPSAEFRRSKFDDDIVDIDYESSEN